MVDYKRTVRGATSVKEIGVLQEPTNHEYGVADFKARPVFSVFDYGTINPPVPLDNSTITLMGGLNFELLRERGIESHYMSLVTNGGEPISAREAITRGIAPTTTRVKFANRLMPQFHNEQWDYGMFGQDNITCYVQPIEFISRNRLPESSSVWRRVERGELSLQDLGLPADFKKGDEIPAELKPILDYSTKFEPDDVYMNAEKAQELLNISGEDFATINQTTRDASNIMTEYAASRGFTRDDGKVEYVGLILGDAVCTWHEDRLTTPQGVGISKQRIRNQVKKLNPKWYEDIERAKQQAKDNSVEDFRTLMDPNIKYTSPTPEFFEAINTLFRAGTNQWVDAKVYDVYSSKSESLKDNLARAVEEFQEMVA